jgi:hypothetical protein
MMSRAPQVTILREQCHALERQRVSLLDQCASLNTKAADAEAEMQVTNAARAHFKLGGGCLAWETSLDMGWPRCEE